MAPLNCSKNDLPRRSLEENLGRDTDINRSIDKDIDVDSDVSMDVDTRIDVDIDKQTLT